MKKVERTPEQRRVLRVHEENLRSIAEGFKGAVERDRHQAPPELLARVLRDSEALAKLRERIPGEVRSVERYIAKEQPSPQNEELNVRLMRIALALYFLDRLDELREAVRKNGGLTLASLLKVAGDRLDRLFDAEYFGKTNRQILNGYLDAQFALESLAAASGVHVHQPYDAVKLFHPKVCEMIGQAERERAGKHV